MITIIIIIKKQSYHYKYNYTKSIYTNVKHRAFLEKLRTFLVKYFTDIKKNMNKNIKNLFNLNNKNIVIAGGAGFLGSQFSSALSNVGAIPIVLDKDKASLKLLKKILNVSKLFI